VFDYLGWRVKDALGKKIVECDIAPGVYHVVWHWSGMGTEMYSENICGKGKRERKREGSFWGISNTALHGGKGG